jgi:hypothetical protein
VRSSFSIASTRPSTFSTPDPLLGMRGPSQVKSKSMVCLPGLGEPPSQSRAPTPASQRVRFRSRKVLAIGATVLSAELVPDASG